MYTQLTRYNTHLRLPSIIQSFAPICTYFHIFANIYYSNYTWISCGHVHMNFHMHIMWTCLLAIFFILILREPSSEMNVLALLDGRARPPRCLVRWKCESPRSCNTSRRRRFHGLGRPLAVPEPFLSRFSTQMNKKPRFEAKNA